MAAQRLLLVVNYRDTEPLGDALMVGLARLPRLGLWRSAVSPGGGPSAAGLGPRGRLAGRDVEEVHARTGGNPFFVAQVGRALMDDPPAYRGPVPAGVREAIRARLARLSPRRSGSCETASVVGRDFTLRVVARMLEASELMCLPLIEEAAAAGLVAGLPPGDHRFVHDLVRDAVEAGLAAAERVRLHRSR